MFSSIYKFMFFKKKKLSILTAVYLIRLTSIFFKRLRALSKIYSTFTLCYFVKSNIVTSFLSWWFINLQETAPQIFQSAQKTVLCASGWNDGIAVYNKYCYGFRFQKSYWFRNSNQSPSK